MLNVHSLHARRLHSAPRELSGTGVRIWLRDEYRKHSREARGRQQVRSASTEYPDLQTDSDSDITESDTEDANRD